ncbi:MAG: agmatinase [Thermoplasmata archaeon]
MASLLRFADAVYDYENANFVIFGVPFDGTTSYRGGARFAPNAIREVSVNLESLVYENGFDMRDARMHDMGNLDESGMPEDAIEDVHFHASNIFHDGKIPIMLGGEHSITAGIARAIRERNIGILFIDAHTDFRDEYLGVKYSHACVARRSYEILGMDRIATVGIRSVSPEEYNDMNFKNYFKISSEEVGKNGIEHAVKGLKDHFKDMRIYLSIDMDGIDPSYAMGVATPEPFGLTPWDVRKIIESFADKIVGADIVEISPPFDNGNTSMLAAKLVQIIVSNVYSKSIQGK